MRKIIFKFLPKRLKSFLKLIFSIKINTQKKYFIPGKCQAQILIDNVIIVVGGAGAIGRAISIRLAMDGARVCLCGRNIKGLESVASEIINIGGSAFAFVCDVKQDDSVENAFNRIYEKFLRIDGLVNCAGGGARTEAKFFHEQNIEIIDHILNVNLRGTMICSKKAASYMLKRGQGKIVNISSIIGTSGKAKYSEYAAAKAGIIGFTKSLAIELSPLGINVNCVSPGKINRGMMSLREIDAAKKCNYVNRPGTPEDVAPIVSFLFSEEATFITGQNVVVDGGRSLGLTGD